MKIAVLGSSFRFDILCRELIAAGYAVDRYRSGDGIPDRLAQDVLILPIPTKTKKGFLNLEGEPVTVESVVEKTDPTTLIISCNFLDPSKRMVDINKREDFAFLNAVPTAEGAITIASAQLGITTFRSRCLIVGFGRIGKVLADRLSALRAQVSVAARNPKDLAFIEALGLPAVPIHALKEKVDRFDVIYQTVPSLILDREVLGNIDKASLIVELSSGSAGTDLNAADQLGIKVISAPGLPEKSAPVTAGLILFESVIRIINEYEKNS